MRADVSQSRPGRRVIPANRHGPVTDQPDWVSLDALVEVELDDGRSVSPPERPTCAGAPLDCSRRELEEGIRSLIFSEPRYLPNDPRADPPQLVTELQAHGVDTTLEALAALPLTIIVSDDVEGLRERHAQTNRKAASE